MSAPGASPAGAGNGSRSKPNAVDLQTLENVGHVAA